MVCTVLGREKLFNQCVITQKNISDLDQSPQKRRSDHFLIFLKSFYIPEQKKKRYFEKINSTHVRNIIYPTAPCQY